MDGDIGKNDIIVWFYRAYFEQIVLFDEIDDKLLILDTWQKLPKTAFIFLFKDCCLDLLNSLQIQCDFMLLKKVFYHFKLTCWNDLENMLLFHVSHVNQFSEKLFCQYWQVFELMLSKIAVKPRLRILLYRCHSVGTEKFRAFQFNLLLSVEFVKICIHFVK